VPWYRHPDEGRLHQQGPEECVVLVRPQKKHWRVNTGPLDGLLLGVTALPQVNSMSEPGLLAPRPLREFDQGALMEELQRRITASFERHQRNYGGVMLDKLHPWIYSSLQGLSQTVATREITWLLGAGFVGGQVCSTPHCTNRASERSHGPNHPRPALFRRAWETVAPNHERLVPLLEVMVEFLRLHLLPEVEFTLQCHPCHMRQARVARNARLAQIQELEERPVLQA